MTKHTRRPRLEYKRLFDRKIQEGLTYEDLHLESGIPTSTLQYWFRQFKAEVAGADPATQQSPFVQVAVEGGDASAVEIVIPSGVVLRVRAGFDEDTVRRLVRALGC